MTRKIVYIVLAGLLTVATVSVFAQGWGRGYHGYGHHGYGHVWMHDGYGYNNRGYGHIDVLKDELNLNEKQVEKILDIDSEFRTKYYKNRGDYDKMLSLQEQHRRQIEKVLTAKQLEKFREFRRSDYWNNRRGFCPYC